MEVAGLPASLRTVFVRVDAQAVNHWRWHGTSVHCQTLEHESLTFRHNDASRRLTDVHGEVIRQVLA